MKQRVGGGKLVLIYCNAILHFVYGEQWSSSAERIAFANTFVKVNGLGSYATSIGIFL